MARAAGVLQLKSGRRVVVSYVRQGRRSFDRLRVHLGPLEQQGLVQVDAWEAGRLSATEAANGNLRSSLESASVVLCLLSADYLVSEFFESDSDNLIASLNTVRVQGTQVMSLVARPCRYNGTGIESFLIANPTVPLSSMTEAEIDESLVEVVNTIANSIS